jgi:hypothetical protein
MDEEFGSFVVTDPDIVDEGIDVSGLRKKTDTSLLGNIPELAGVQYEAFNPNRLSDLMRFYQTGLPTRSVSQPTTPPATGGGGSGGGGQATTPITTPITTPVTTPTTTATTTTPFIETSPNVLSATDPITGQPTSGNIIDPKTGDVFAPGDYSDVAGTLADPREKIDFTPQQQSTIQNILGQAGQTVDSALTQLGKIPGAVVDAANQTVDLFGKKINIGKTLAAAAINKIAGGPVSLVFEAAKALAPERDPRQNALDELYDVKDGTIQSGLMKGYNPVSGGFPGVSEPTFGLQDAYDKRIDTIENTLKDKYNMSDAEIADVKAGSYKGDVDTNLLDTLVDLEDAKAREKDVLDAAETGAPQENIGATDTIASLQDKERLDQQRLASLTGDVDFGTTPTRNITTDITSDQIDEFGTAPATSVTRPGTETVLGKPGIDLFDDAETGIELDTTDPGNRQTIIDRALDAGVGNVEKHFENNTKLAQARDLGIISGEDYNILGGYDVTQNITGGSTFVGGALNMFGSPVYNVGQGFFDMTGETEQIATYNEDGTISYTTTPTSKQRLEDIPGTVARNTVGGYGLVSQDQKNVHNAIVNGNLDTPEGIAAVKNQIEMSQFRDPIMDMVPSTPDSILAGTDDAFSYLDDIDISQDAPTAPAPTGLRYDTEFEDLADVESIGLSPRADINTTDKFITPFETARTVIKNPNYVEPGSIAPLEDDFESLVDPTPRERAAASQRAAEAAEKDRQQRERDAADAARERAAASQRAAQAAENDRQQRERDAADAARERAAQKSAAPVYQDAIMRGQTGGGSSPGCFIKGTLITMADKTTKPVEQVDLEDEVAVGGKVFAVGKFLNTELYDYKGIKVSGSHMVNEEGVWMRVRDTKHGKSLGDDKHTVYVFGSENRRILINGILFTDYFEVKDQEQLLKKENKFFDNWKTFANNEDINNVNTLNAS